ncbi:hypothetical protein CKO24_13660 [Rhodothalassium salexigens DSM 2132]|nr:hypothetical protein [Rhodothalassium salexigens DSM 2132]
MLHAARPAGRRHAVPVARHRAQALADPALDRLNAIRQGLRAIFHIWGMGLVRSRKVEVSVSDGNRRLAITLPASLPVARTKARLH